MSKNSYTSLTRAANGRHSCGGKATTQHKNGTTCECGWRGNDAKCLSRHRNKCIVVKEKKAALLEKVSK